jgi:hypothetical protein
MKPHDLDRFRTALERTAAVFSRPLTDEVLSAYFDALRPFAVEAIERALKAHEARARFFPKPGEIRDRLDEAAKTANDQQKPAIDTGHYSYRADCPWQLQANTLGLSALWKHDDLLRGPRDLVSRETWAILRRTASQFAQLAADGDPDATLYRMAQSIKQQFAALAAEIGGGKKAAA